jgi:hypothetical protein
MGLGSRLLNLINACKVFCAFVDLCSLGSVWIWNATTIVAWMIPFNYFFS